MSPQHPHQLKLTHNGQTKCNLCGNRSAVTWNCSTCSYDECLVCFAQSHSKPKVERVVVVEKAITKKTLCRPQHHATNIVMSTKLQGCFKCRKYHGPDQPRWACQSCDYVMCLKNCYDAPKPAGISKHSDVRILVEVKNFERINAQNPNLKDAIMAVLKSNQEEIKAMEGVIKGACGANDQDWHVLNGERQKLEQSKMKTNTEANKTKLELTQLAKDLANMVAKMTAVGTELNEANEDLRVAEEKADKKREAHWLWCGATLAFTFVVPLVAVIAAGNAVGTYRHLKRFEKRQQELKESYDDLVCRRYSLLERKEEADKTQQAILTRQRQLNEEIKSIKTAMESLRMQTLELEQFKASMKTMKFNIANALSCIQHVVATVGYGVHVAQALEQTLSESRGQFALAWSGASNLVEQLGFAQLKDAEYF